jgi:hypothetical protein
MKKNINNDNEILKDENGKQVVINSDKQLDGDDLVDKKTLKKYRIHWYQRIPYPVRALLIKYWFFGLNYFLFDMGIGALEIFQKNDFGSNLILWLIGGFALGVFNDIFLYNILDVIEDYPKESKPYVIFKSKKLYSLFINIVYGLLIGYLSHIICGSIVLAINSDTENLGWWFREPFTCALVMFVLDGAIIALKNFLVLLVKNIRGTDSNQAD